MKKQADLIVLVLIRTQDVGPLGVKETRDGSHDALCVRAIDEQNRRAGHVQFPPASGSLRKLRGDSISACGRRPAMVSTPEPGSLVKSALGVNIWTLRSRGVRFTRESWLGPGLPKVIVYFANPDLFEIINVTASRATPFNVDQPLLSMLLAVLRARFRFQGAVEHFALRHQIGIGSGESARVCTQLPAGSFFSMATRLRCDSSDLMKQGAKVTDGLESQLESHFFGRAVFLLKQPARLVDQ